MKTGRPIGFDKEAALEAAMLLFWERGYEGASMAELSQVMGLNVSSIYAAYGDKHSLFEHAVKRYLGTRAGYMTEALQKATLPEVIRAMFENTVSFLTSSGQPATCMTLGGTMGCGSDATAAKDLLAEIRRQNEGDIRKRLLVARRDGELSPDVDLNDYSRYLSMLLTGLSVQSANGSSRAELKRTARVALEHLGY